MNSVLLWIEYMMRKMGIKVAVRVPNTTLNAFLYPIQSGDVLVDNGFTNTLVFLADNCPDNQRKNAIKYHKKIGANSIVLNVCNSDRGCPTSPYMNIWSGDFDDGKLKRWQNWCIECLYAGLVPIVSFVCVESSGDRMAKGPYEEHERCIKRLVETLDAYVGMWVVGWEASKFWTPDYTNTIARIFKCYTKKQVGVHNQGASHGKGENIDFLAYETHWNPRIGDSYPPSTVVNELNGIMNAVGKPVVLAEYNVNSDGGLAKTQGSEGLKAGAKGAWNGW